MNKVVKHENSLLTQCVVEGPAADILAQGGVVLGKHMFTSEFQLLQLCLKEYPKGDAFTVLMDG